jgi:microcystin-dependent protein
MSEYTSSNITVTVPDSNQSANMITAFENYHDDIAPVISGKELVITGAATSVISSNFTANSVLVANATGKISSYSTITTSNLSVLDGLTSQSEILFPPGIISSYIGFDVPDGWLFCNGATVLKSSYPNLVNVLAVTVPISSIEITGDNETSDWEVYMGLPINLQPFNGGIGVSVSISSAARTATRLAEVPGFPESNTLFYTATEYSDSTLIWYGNGYSEFSNTFNNDNGVGGLIYDESQLGITIHLYGYPTSVNEMVLPDFRSRFIYGANAMSITSSRAGTFQHQHGITGSARIDFSGTNVFVQEVSVPSWSATERFTISGSSANTSSRTTAVNVTGTSNSITIMPPYITAKYIIKT